MSQIIKCNYCDRLGHAVVTDCGSLLCAYCELDTAVPMMKGTKLIVYKTNWPKDYEDV